MRKTRAVVAALVMLGGFGIGLFATAASFGMVQWEAGGKHLPENTGDKPFELILVELKSKAATAK